MAELTLPITSTAIMYTSLQIYQNGHLFFYIYGSIQSWQICTKTGMVPVPVWHDSYVGESVLSDYSALNLPAFKLLHILFIATNVWLNSPHHRVSSTTL